MTELFLGFDPSDVSATDEPTKNKPPVKTIPPWKRVETVIEGTPAPQSDVSDCSQQIQAATGNIVPSAVEAYNASIEDSDGSVLTVNIANQLTKKDIADGTFDGAFRAQARFDPPVDETPIEKVHRFRCDDVDWKYTVRTIYREEHGKDIDEDLLPAEVKRWQKKHTAAYPHFYEK